MHSEKKRHVRRKARIALMGAVMTIALVPVGALPAAADPPTTIIKQVLVQRVPNVQVTDGTTTVAPSNLGTLVILDNGNAYMTKTKTSAGAGTGWSTFHRILDFNTTSASTAVWPVTLGGVPFDLGHGNGLAYYRSVGTDPTVVGSFYVAMMKGPGEYQVAQLNATGKVTNQFLAKKGAVDKQIASITHVSGGDWIVGTAGENIPDPSDPNQILKPYYQATIVGNTFELGNKFYVPTSTTYNIGQDIYYDASLDQLLVPVWDGSNTVGTATGRGNRIIAATLGTIVDGHVYVPARWMDLMVPATSASKFEIEGIARDSSGRLFVSTNGNAPDGSAIDSVYKIVSVP